MSHYHVGLEFALQRFEPIFEIDALVGEVAVAKLAQHDLLLAHPLQEGLGRLGRLVGARAHGAEHDPADLEVDPPLDPVEKCAAAPDFDVVGVGAEAQHAPRRTGGCE